MTVSAKYKSLKECQIWFYFYFFLYFDRTSWMNLIHFVSLCQRDYSFKKKNIVQRSLEGAALFFFFFLKHVD